MSSLASAPPPLHIIRSHNSPISALFVSGDNERIYSGDISGLVVITSTRTLRPLASWKAHKDGLLGVEEWGKHVITHGRDNKLHVWNRPSQPSTVMGGSASAPGTPELELGYSLDVNALNFCRFSLLPLADATRPSVGSEPRRMALIAVPNLVESSLADIWTLPSMERIHAAIGKGIIMSLHLLPARPGSANRVANRALSLIASYENGSVKLWRYRDVEKERSIEGVGWECVWSLKLHVESVMATAVSSDRSIAISVSADHLVGRYDLGADPDSNLESVGTVHRTKHPGNGAVAFHDGGRVCAVGGWDGRVRLFSTKSFKSLGTLICHKAAVQALAFASACPVSARRRCYRVPVGSGGGGGSDGGEGRRVIPDTRTTAGTSDVDASGSSAGQDGDGDSEDDDDDDDEMTSEEKARRSRWLVSGGKDGRVAVWGLMDFNARSVGGGGGGDMMDD
ncbi:WD40-repeat-containing domain protein [Lactifluus subvellereus]|nr:WD40-repeat-containing domain protein [Lactifluus subvellereus]